MQKKLIIFIDSGDTLIDESTQVFAENGDVLSAELFPGAREALNTLKARGYLIALVADGRDTSFCNVYNRLGLRDRFDAWVVSQTVGAEKPDAIMFETAMRALGLQDTDKRRVVMVGNNLARDILGANRFGITSILQGLSPRYRMTPLEKDEEPDYTVQSLDELVPLVERLNAALVSSVQVI